MALWSPRRSVRVDSTRTHQYTEAPFPTDATNVPYALYLADTRGQFHVLGVDFDDTDDADPIADAHHFSQWLNNRNIVHTLQRSGISRGRHVWVALTQPAPANIVANAARRLKNRYPSMDLSALLNPATGCLRPPGSAHRAGGTATVIDADGADLSDTDAIANIVNTAAGTSPVLWAHLFADYPETETRRGPSASATAHIRPANSAPKAVAATAKSTDFNPSTPQELPALRYLTRQRRGLSELPESTRTALTTPLQRGENGSARAFRILRGCARAQWSIDDVLRLLPASHPGLIHLTHRRVGRVRVPRSSTRAYTVRQYQRAQQSLLKYPFPEPSEPRDVDHAVAAVLYAADHDAALQDSSETITVRIALEALLHFCLIAGTSEIDLSVRRWAVATGLSANTIARLSRQLQQHGYVTCTQPHAGTRANRYRIHVPAGSVAGVTQGEPAPYRNALPTLTQRLRHFTRDAWDTRHGLGWDTALLAWHLHTGTRSTPALVASTGLTEDRIRVLISRLRQVKLLPKRGLKPVLGTRSTARAAHELGVAGVLANRARRYVAETIRWAWMHQELTWRTARRGHKPPPQDVFLRAQLGKFPTNSDGRLDLPEAMSRVLTAMDNAA